MSVSFSIRLFWVFTFIFNICKAQSHGFDEFDTNDLYDLSTFERDEDGVLILNEGNFDLVISVHDYLLVHFCKKKN